MSYKLRDIRNNINLTGIILDLLTVLIPFFSWIFVQIMLDREIFTFSPSEADTALVPLILAILASSRALRVTLAVKDKKKKQSATGIFIMCIILIIACTFAYFIALLSNASENFKPSDLRFLMYAILIILSLIAYLWNGVFSEYYEKKNKNSKT